MPENGNVKGKGRIAIISHAKFGIKLEGFDFWFNAHQQKVQDAFESLQKGDEVEYEATKDRELVFVQLVTPPFQKGSETQHRAGPDFDQLMEDTVKKIGDIRDKQKDEEFKKTTDWSKLAITLFMAKSGRR